jgi:hypothetical protein
MCNILIYFCNIKMKHLKHLKHTLITWALLGRMEARRRGGRWRRMDVVVQRRHGQLADGCSVTRISSPSLTAGASVMEARWFGGGGCGSPAQWRRLWLAGRPWRGGYVVEADWAGGEYGVEEDARMGHGAAARRSGVGGWAR